MFMKFYNLVNLHLNRLNKSSLFLISNTSNSRFRFTQETSIFSTKKPRKKTFRRNVSTNRGYFLLKNFYISCQKDKPSFIQRSFYKVTICLKYSKKQIIRFFTCKQALNNFLRCCVVVGVVILSCVLYRKTQTNYGAELRNQVSIAKTISPNNYSNQNLYEKPTLNYDECEYNKDNWYADDWIFENTKDAIIKQHETCCYPFLENQSTLFNYQDLISKTKESALKSLKANTKPYIGLDCSSQYHSLTKYISDKNTPISELRLHDVKQNRIAQRLSQVDNLAQSILKTKFNPYLGFELDTTSNDVFKEGSSSIKGLYLPIYDSYRVCYNAKMPNVILKNDTIEFEIGGEFKKYGNPSKENQKFPLITQSITLNYSPPKLNGSVSFQIARSDVLHQNRCLVTKTKETSFSVSWRFSPRFGKRPQLQPKLQGGINDNNLQIVPFNPVFQPEDNNLQLVPLDLVLQPGVEDENGITHLLADLPFSFLPERPESQYILLEDQYEIAETQRQMEQQRSLEERIVKEVKYRFDLTNSFGLLERKPDQDTINAWLKKEHFVILQVEDWAVKGYNPRPFALINKGCQLIRQIALMNSPTSDIEIFQLNQDLSLQSVGNKVLTFNEYFYSKYLSSLPIDVPYPGGLPTYKHPVVDMLVARMHQVSLVKAYRNQITEENKNVLWFCSRRLSLPPTLIELLNSAYQQHLFARTCRSLHPHYFQAFLALGILQKKAFAATAMQLYQTHLTVNQIPIFNRIKTIIYPDRTLLTRKTLYSGVLVAAYCSNKLLFGIVGVCGFETFFQTLVTGLALDQRLAPFFDQLWVKQLKVPQDMIGPSHPIFLNNRVLSEQIKKINNRYLVEVNGGMIPLYLVQFFYLATRT